MERPNQAASNGEAASRRFLRGGLRNDRVSSVGVTETESLRIRLDGRSAARMSGCGFRDKCGSPPRGGRADFARRASGGRHRDFAAAGPGAPRRDRVQRRRSNQRDVGGENLTTAWNGYRWTIVVASCPATRAARPGPAGEWVDTQTAPIAANRWPLQWRRIWATTSPRYTGTGRPRARLAATPSRDPLRRERAPAFGLNGVFVGGDENYGGFSEVFRQTFGDYYVLA